MSHAQFIVSPKLRNKVDRYVGYVNIANVMLFAETIIASHIPFDHFHICLICFLCIVSYRHICLNETLSRRDAFLNTRVKVFPYWTPYQFLGHKSHYSRQAVTKLIILLSLSLSNERLLSSRWLRFHYIIFHMLLLGNQWLVTSC